MINAIESYVWNQTNNQRKGLVRVREESRSSLQLPQVGRQGKLELRKTVENVKREVRVVAFMSTVQSADDQPKPPLDSVTVFANVDFSRVS
jgi:hypothetical protein